MVRLHLHFDGCSRGSRACGPSRAIPRSEGSARAATTRWPCPGTLFLLLMRRFVFWGVPDCEAWASGEVGGFETYIEAEDEGDADAAVYAGESGEGGEEGGDLLSVEAQHNCLSIVLRDPGTLRFVKYVSAFAPSARCDVEVACRIHDEDLPDPEAAEDLATIATAFSGQGDP